MPLALRVTCQSACGTLPGEHLSLSDEQTARLPVLADIAAAGDGDVPTLQLAHGSAAVLAAVNDSDVTALPLRDLIDLLHVRTLCYTAAGPIRAVYANEVFRT
jgi:hypothetical protein